MAKKKQVPELPPEAQAANAAVKYQTVSPSRCGPAGLQAGTIPLPRDIIKSRAASPH